MKKQYSSASGSLKRWSVRRKVESVLLLLQRGALHGLSRELGVSGSLLAEWRDIFIAGGEGALKDRPRTALDEETRRLRSMLGEKTMDLELLEAKVRIVESGVPHWPEEVEMMIQKISPSTKRPYRLDRVCRVWKVPRTTVYRHRRWIRNGRPPPRRRGPKPKSD